MKFPKNRANLYIVVREFQGQCAILGGFADFHEADDYRESCQQEWIDKTGDLDSVSFGTRLTTFYG